MKLNRLAKEQSPYLLQHQHNPVDWYPWGEEAFQAAKEQDKPIFISIGYSSCYWCHVMERDSFESKDVAKILNEYFISIKVDREERPDVDQIYMDAALIMSGHGGWPLSAFLTPDLKPFFAATFFPKAQFITLLGKIAEMWEDDDEELINSAEQVVQNLNVESQLGRAITIPPDILERLQFQLEQNFDAEYGGFGPAPKFPPSQAIRNLLRFYSHTKSEQALNMATLTLEKMARGGIFDHLGGGFARYSVDDRWLIPHFEKMLYDNALLIVTYLEAYQVTKKEMFKDVALLTIKYLMKEMYSEAFFSAQDAGDVGKEGEYYSWSIEELTNLLNKEELELLKSAYGVSEIGNFEEQQNILNLQNGYEWSVRKEESIKNAFLKLQKQRNDRHAPHLDDKILTSWNALVISALCKAAQVLDEPGYLEAATKCIDFIKNNLYKNGTLLRRYRNGESGVLACLDDYSYLIQACLDLYETKSNSDWLNLAIELQATLDQKFWKDTAYVYANPDSEELIIKKKDLVDNATPSGNGVAALNLLRLYHLTYNNAYQSRAEELIMHTMPMIEKYPAGFNSMLLAIDFLQSTPLEIVASNKEDIKKFLFEEFIPNKVVVWTDDKELNFPKLAEGKKPGAVYICKNQTCLPAIENLEKLKEKLRDI